MRTCQSILSRVRNKKDSRAIAFKCYIRDKWHVIGYIVREALDDVHDTLRNNALTEVKFPWTQYVIDWPQSGGGFYAGIRIPRKGRWSNGVVAPSDGHTLDLTLN